ncbi:MAG: type II toxin-antitoxin system VapC family toxin [Terriglobales bacterium]
MNRRYLLDTNILIAVLNKDTAVVRRVGAVSEVLISVISIGELLRGAYGSQRMESNLQRVRGMAARLPVIPCTVATAESYGRIKQGLRSKGRPVPDNDIWIAATARQQGLVLATRDRHFREIEELTIEEW